MCVRHTVGLPATTSLLDHAHLGPIVGLCHLTLGCLGAMPHDDWNVVGCRSNTCSLICMVSELPIRPPPLPSGVPPLCVQLRAVRPHGKWQRVELGALPQDIAPRDIREWALTYPPTPAGATDPARTETPATRRPNLSSICLRPYPSDLAELFSAASSDPRMLPLDGGTRSRQSFVWRAYADVVNTIKHDDRTPLPLAVQLCVGLHA